MISASNLERIELLQKYSEKKPSVLIAFLFGSQTKNRAREGANWDIGVYFKSREYLELEKEDGYPNENRIWSDLVGVVQADVDFLVLNRARPSLVFSILNSGLPLVIKDRKLYLRLLCKASYEAIDF